MNNKALEAVEELIKKFDDEFDEEDKKKNPNRYYACICPDAEEVYKRYYELKKQLQQKENIINKAIEELYIWGETLNPEFQKRVLEILEKSDK